jgi:hypothetical protein
MTKAKESHIYEAQVCCPNCKHQFIVRHTSGDDVDWEKFDEGFAVMDKAFEKFNEAFKSISGSFKIVFRGK